MDDRLLDTINQLVDAEIKRDRLAQQLAKVNETVDVLEESLERLKLEMKAEQEALKAAFEEGGVPPDEEYPEYLDEAKLTYHTKDDLLLHSKARQLLEDEPDRGIPSE